MRWWRWPDCLSVGFLDAGIQRRENPFELYARRACAWVSTPVALAQLLQREAGHIERMQQVLLRCRPDERIPIDLDQPLVVSHEQHSLELLDRASRFLGALL